MRHNYLSWIGYVAGALRSVACGPKVPTPGQGQTVEIGAEATVDTKDDWQVAQHQLYGELSQQLQKLWANGKTAQNGSQSHVEAAQVPEPTATPPEPPEHLCQEHQTPFKRYHRGDSVWYSHKTADGKWCKEK